MIAFDSTTAAVAMNSKATKVHYSHISKGYFHRIPNTVATAGAISPLAPCSGCYRIVHLAGLSSSGL